MPVSETHIKGPENNSDSDFAQSIVIMSALAGVLDASVALSYVVGLTAMYWELGSLAIKFCLLVLYSRFTNQPRGLAIYFFACIFGMTILSTIHGFLVGFMAPEVPTGSLSSVQIGYIGTAAFIANLALTIALVNPARLRTYMGAAAVTILVVSLIHTGLTASGKMFTVWGRPTFFRTESNLGGEIEAAGAIAAIVALPQLSAAIVVCVLLIDSSLLQARAAMISEAACLGVLFVFNAKRRLSLPRAAALSAFISLGGLILAATALTGTISESLSRALLVDDTYRGVLSGGSGRAALWSQAISLFMDSPIWGHYLGYFSYIGYIGSHNIVLYGLAQYGIASLSLFIVILAALSSIFRRERFEFCAAICAIPLLLFNDRFINLNPYPYLFYVLIFVDRPQAQKAFSAAKRTVGGRRGVGSLAAQTSTQIAQRTR